MSLPVIQQYTRELPKQEFVANIKTNIKSPRVVGISNLDKPSWLKIRPPNAKYHELRTSLRELGMVTVCQESHCPNMSECWSRGTATFMVLGDTCTRACRFCNVKARGIPPPPDPTEPQRLAAAIERMQAKYVVLTCVDRDDLPDGGAAHLAACVRAAKETGALVEVLSGDFQGNADHLKILIDSGVDVLAHNIETVKRLQETVRDRRAGYAQSLQVLARAKELNPAVITKSSIMVGLGETREEITQAMHDLLQNNCDILTFGQYLQPSSWHLTVEYYMPPEEFTQLQEEAHAAGFRYCASGPFVRSSYKAADAYYASKEARL